MTYDLLIVGAGPAGLSAAIRFKQLANDASKELSVCVLEKGAQVGAHILSGAVIDPKALDELIPEWHQLGAPLTTEVKQEHFYWLTAENKYKFPMRFLPPLMLNDGNYIGSLGELCQWLAIQAESLGVEIYPGFSAVDVIFTETGALKGVVTGDLGLDATGAQKAEFSPGIEIHASYTFFAEGTRGSLTKKAEDHFQLRGPDNFQKYGIGLKEIWEVSPDKHQLGLVEHSVGWPLTNNTGGGSFLYHYGKNLVSIGFIVHLDYQNPYLSPFEEFQRFKKHPQVRSVLEGGRRISYGARAISEGGIQSLPELVFAGGVLIGCSAGMVNVPRIKGSHNAMKSGMLAAEAAFEAMESGRANDRLDGYMAKLQSSWVWKDLYRVRNAKPWISRLGTFVGGFFSVAELWLTSIGLNLPWTIKHKQPDHLCTKLTTESEPIYYEKPDNKLSFDRLSSIALSNIAHEHNQPCHLKLKNEQVPIQYNLKYFGAPEQLYCPAGVYEVISIPEGSKLQINAQNCIHCKTCDIKDPRQNINWVPPEGGSGPIYSQM
ncbi:electron transfer flavoprotein-ubiquinone oxidoreductase [Sulfuriferula nivalis]|uniref:Electron transfer flavoprotein-ubiquinone oxidoreductase n=1 Tax=Sulfuriferula nivalis TaxID=2675298 RepID=A0A809RG51_9PROT|nr:electron transfer flavoprotein-ubiquinone oxidoreductase [Sulfuriferula nivalis]BBP00565.1 electron transfer flavoprotein-ubiquinone oxidoreductase [Sulfuriferula nivalis]